MRNYTLMNFVHSFTGYYYKSALDLETYINSKISFKQLHFKTVEKDLLLDTEINFLSLECDAIKEQYQKHLDTIGRVYWYFALIVLVTIFYFIINNLLNDKGFILSILVTCLHLLIVPTLLSIWIPGWLKASKGEKLVNKINSIESFIQSNFKEKKKNESTPINRMDTVERDVLLSCISILNNENMIEVIDNKLLDTPHTYTEVLSPLSQIELATYLAFYFQKKSIEIKNDSNYKLMAQCISENMKQKNGLAVNSSSFNVEFNRAFNSYI